MSDDSNDLTRPVLHVTPGTLAVGDARVHSWLRRIDDDRARPLVAFAHGAGAGAEHPRLVRLASDLAARGAAVLTFNFPYIEAGRRLPPRDREPLLATWEAALTHARTLTDAGVWLAGKSMGGRMASLGVADGRLTGAGLVYYGYPLHPAGKPERPRSAHLPAIDLPQLFLAGTRDKLATIADLRAVVAGLPRATLVECEGADHDFRVRKKDPLTEDQVLARIADAAADFVGAIPRS